MAKSDYPKGSVGNPYTPDEYQSMMDNNSWKGGFVETGKGKYEYFRNNLYEGNSGCGCGSDGGSEGSGSDTGSGSNVQPLNGSGSVGSSCWSGEISSVNDLGNDCVYKCLEFLGGKFKLNLTSEAFRYDYLTANMGREGWCGTNDVNQYLNGPNTYDSESTLLNKKYNSKLLQYLNCFFQMGNDSWTRDMDEIRTYFNEHEPSDKRGCYLALLDTGKDNGSAHAVVITGKAGKNLWIYDPALVLVDSETNEVNQGDPYYGNYYTDSKIICTVLITGIK
ncbi:MAG: hypothetical protein K5945_07390 [Bacteroidaceae bacterium]|nr:hypothetical protein [Bacteroidaceae bacterium]